MLLMDIINYLRNKIAPNKQHSIRSKKIHKLKKTPKRKFNTMNENSNIDSEIAENLEKIATIEHKEDDFVCPLCLKFIVCAVITPCGHTFCEICLEEYLLYFPVR